MSMYLFDNQPDYHTYCKLSSN